MLDHFSDCKSFAKQPGNDSETLYIGYGKAVIDLTSEAREKFIPVVQFLVSFPRGIHKTKDDEVSPLVKSLAPNILHTCPEMSEGFNKVQEKGLGG